MAPISSIGLALALLMRGKVEMGTENPQLGDHASTSRNKNEIIFRTEISLNTGQLTQSTE